MAKRKYAENPTEIYHRRRREIARLIDWLNMHLERHEQEFRSTWAEVGDLAQTHAQLIAVVAFIANVELEDIEQLLADTDSQ